MDNIRIINWKKFALIKEVELGTFIELSELMKEMGDEQLSLPLIQQFASNSKKLKRFVCLALDPIAPQGEDYDKWEDLQHINISTLIEVIGDFFASSGPLKAAFPDVLSLARVSKQMPMTGSAN